MQLLKQQGAALARPQPPFVTPRIASNGAIVRKHTKTPRRSRVAPCHPSAPPPHIRPLTRKLTVSGLFPVPPTHTKTMAVDDSSSDAGSPLDTASDGPGTPPATPPAPRPHSGDALAQGVMELYEKNRAAFTEPQGDALDQGVMEIYQANRAAFADPVKPVAPPKAPARPVGFGQRLGDFFTAVKDGSNNTVNAISRGAVDAVNDASNTVVGIGGVAVNAAIRGAQHAHSHTRAAGVHSVAQKHREKHTGGPARAPAGSLPR